MARRAAKPRPVTPQELAAAVRALGINVPVRSAERKGNQIILHTRNGDFAYTPEPPPQSPPASGGEEEAPPRGHRNGHQNGVSAPSKQGKSGAGGKAAAGNKTPVNEGAP